ncbi:CHRD domain-containing protein [Ottowia caeni]|uniref:CHRD domain-containing protein n=1 Tax=Ottowia caeni TaxID=2870339 RepID=UPI001E3D272D
MNLRLSCFATTWRPALAVRAARNALGLALIVVLSACAIRPIGPTAPPVRTTPSKVPDRQPELAAFSAQLSGRNAVPRSNSAGQGTIVAVLNRKTGLLRWKLSFDGLSGPVRAAHFHGPAMDDEVASPLVALGQRGIISPSEGRAVLTPSQRADLLAGQWYVNLTTERHPEGEIRGQLIEK